jgi:hypothetical protein
MNDVAEDAGALDLLLAGQGLHPRLKIKNNDNDFHNKKLLSNSKDIFFTFLRL